MGPRCPLVKDRERVGTVPQGNIHVHLRNGAGVRDDGRGLGRIRGRRTSFRWLVPLLPYSNVAH